MASKTPRLRFLIIVIIVGILVSLATGLVRRNISLIPEIQHYGYPLFWRVIDPWSNGPTRYVVTNLAINIAFWVTIFLLAFFFFWLLIHLGGPIETISDALSVAEEEPRELYEKLLDRYMFIYGSGSQRLLDNKLKSLMEEGLSREEAIRKLAEKEGLLE